MSWYLTIVGDQNGYQCRRCNKFVPLEQFKPCLCECMPPQPPIPTVAPGQPLAVYPTSRKKRDKRWYLKEKPE